MANRLTTLIGNMTLLTVFIVLTMGFCEIAVRILCKAYIFYDIEMWRYAVDLKQPSKSAELSHEHRPGASGYFMGVDVAINSKGLRDTEYTYEKPDSTFRILLLGDSITLGWGVRQGHIYADVLEKQLNHNLNLPRYKRFEVINAGVGNYNTEHELYYLESEGLKYHPDMVMICFFVNDGEIIKHRESISFLDRNSYLWTMMKGRLDMMTRMMSVEKDYVDFYNDLYIPGSPGRTAFDRAFNQILQICRRIQIDPFVVLYPELHVTDETSYPFKKVHQLVRDLSAAYEAPVVDLLPIYQGEIPESLWVAPDDAHPNARAHNMAADAIYQHLASYLQRSTTEAISD